MCINRASFLLFEFLVNLMLEACMTTETLSRFKFWVILANRTPDLTAFNDQLPLLERNLKHIFLLFGFHVNCGDNDNLVVLFAFKFFLWFLAL